MIQAWQKIHYVQNIPISDRTFWGTVYGMALGVNYGAFSTAFSASLAGLLWRDILARKHIRVRRLDFARVNLPIIASKYLKIASAVSHIGDMFDRISYIQKSRFSRLLKHSCHLPNFPWFLSSTADLEVLLNSRHGGRLLCSRWRNICHPGQRTSQNLRLYSSCTKQYPKQYPAMNFLSTL